MKVKRIHPEFHLWPKSHGQSSPSIDTLRNAVDESTAVIQPFKYENEETGDVVSVTVSPLYAIITVNDCSYYCVRETGQFDGTSVARYRGPVLISPDEE